MEASNKSSRLVLLCSYTSDACTFDMQASLVYEAEVDAAGPLFVSAAGVPGEEAVSWAGRNPVLFYCDGLQALCWIPALTTRFSQSLSGGPDAGRVGSQDRAACVGNWEQRRCRAHWENK